MQSEPVSFMAEENDARHWDQHYAGLNYDDAVRERAEELSALFPDDVGMFAADNQACAFLLASDDAQDAYAAFVDRICQEKAEAEWR